MNRSLFLLAHKNNKSVSKRIIFILIIVLILLIIYIPFSFYKTYNDSINFIKDLTYEFRIIEVDESYKDKVQELNLENNKNVVKIFYKSFDMESTTAVFSKVRNDDVSIYPAIETFTPSVIYGNSLKNEYDMICPDYMVPKVQAGNDISTYINMKDYLNETFTLTFHTYRTNKETNIRERIEYPYDFKLVGLYSGDYTYSYNRCYIKEDTFFSIAPNLVSEHVDEYENPIKIYVNKNKMVDKITSILDKNNIPYFVPYLVTDFLDTTLNISLILLISFIVISLFILNLYLKIYIKDKNKTILLYKSLGFKDKDLSKILLYSILELLIKSLIISSIIIIIIKYIILYLLRNNITFRLLNIKISLLPNIIFVLIIMLFIKFIINKHIKNMNKKSIKELNI